MLLLHTVFSLSSYCRGAAGNGMGHTRMLGVNEAVGSMGGLAA